MFGIIYIVLSLLAGKELAEILCLQEKRSGSRQQERTAQSFSAIRYGFWRQPLLEWEHWYLDGQRTWSPAMASEAGAKKPLIYGNTAVLIITAVVLVLLYWKRYRKTGTVWTVADRKLISDSRAFRKECIFWIPVGIWRVDHVLCFLYKKWRTVQWGFPYTGIMHHIQRWCALSQRAITSRQSTRISEDRMSNIIFMFQFLVGNLEFLGIRLDVYNIESVLAAAGISDVALQHCKTTDSKQAWQPEFWHWYFFLPQFTFIFSFCDRTSTGKRPVCITLRDNTTFIDIQPMKNWDYGILMYIWIRGIWHLDSLIVSLLSSGYLWTGWISAKAPEEEKGSLSISKNPDFLQKRRGNVSARKMHWW